MKANLWSLNIYRQKAGWEGCWQRPSGALFLTSSPSHPHFSKNSSHFGKDWVSEWSRSVMPDSLRPHGLHGLPGSSVHGIFQARVLEWVAISMETNVPDFQPGEKISTKGRVRGGWESYVKTQGQTLSNRFVNALPEAISLWLDVNVLSINTTYTDKTAFSLAFDLLDL